VSIGDFALFITSLRRAHRDVVARVAAEMLAAPDAAALETSAECALRTVCTLWGRWRGC
jgi:hypothetical protein